MYRDNKVAVVIPAFNEQELIGETINGIPDFVDTIVVVDDASTDQTVRIVKQYQARQAERIHLIRHASNGGVGAGIASGYKWCAAQDIDIAVVMAGDNQMDAADLPALLDPVANDEVDYAKGNRLFTGDAWNQIPKIRYMGNSALSLLTKIASGYWHIADSQSGYTAINRRALQTVAWDKMYKRYGQPNDILVRLNVHNFRVTDVHIRPVYGIGEKSGVNPVRLVPKLTWLLLTLFFWRMKEKYIIRDFHPLIFFYGLAIVLMMASVLLFGRLIWRWYLFGAIPPINALALMFTGIAGMQSMFFAMWFDMTYNRHLQ